MTTYIITTGGDIIEIPDGTYRKWGEHYVTIKDGMRGDELAVIPRETVSAVMMTDNFEVTQGNAN